MKQWHVVDSVPGLGFSLNRSRNFREAIPVNYRLIENKIKSVGQNFNEGLCNHTSQLIDFLVFILDFTRFHLEFIS